MYAMTLVVHVRKSFILIMIKVVTTCHDHIMHIQIILICNIISQGLRLHTYLIGPTVNSKRDLLLLMKITQ